MSVVIWVKAGPIRALLGADLEHTSRNDQGWAAVLGCHAGLLPAQIFSKYRIMAPRPLTMLPSGKNVREEPRGGRYAF